MPKAVRFIGNWFSVAMYASWFFALFMCFLTICRGVYCRRDPTTNPFAEMTACCFKKTGVGHAINQTSDAIKSGSAAAASGVVSVARNAAAKISRSSSKEGSEPGESSTVRRSLLKRFKSNTLLSAAMGELALNRVTGDVYFNRSAEVCGVGGVVRTFGLYKAVHIMAGVNMIMRFIFAIFTIALKVIGVLLVCYGAMMLVIGFLAADLSNSFKTALYSSPTAMNIIRADGLLDRMRQEPTPQLALERLARSEFIAPNSAEREAMIGTSRILDVTLSDAATDDALNTIASYSVVNGSSAPELLMAELTEAFGQIASGAEGFCEFLSPNGLPAMITQTCATLDRVVPAVTPLAEGALRAIVGQLNEGVDILEQANARYSALSAQAINTAVQANTLTTSAISLASPFLDPAQTAAANSVIGDVNQAVQGGLNQVNTIYAEVLNATNNALNLLQPGTLQRMADSVLTEIRPICNVASNITTHLGQGMCYPLAVVNSCLRDRDELGVEGLNNCTRPAFTTILDSLRLVTPAITTVWGEKDRLLIWLDVMKQAAYGLNENWPFDPDYQAQMRPLMRDLPGPTVLRRRLSSTRTPTATDFNVFRLVTRAMDADSRNNRDILLIIEDFDRNMRDFQSFNFRFCVACIIFAIGCYWICSLWDRFCLEVLKRALFIEQTHAFHTRFPEFAAAGTEANSLARGSSMKQLTLSQSSDDSSPPKTIGTGSRAASSTPVRLPEVNVELMTETQLTQSPSKPQAHPAALKPEEKRPSIFASLTRLFSGPMPQYEVSPSFTPETQMPLNVRVMSFRELPKSMPPASEPA